MWNHLKNCKQNLRQYWLNNFVTIFLLQSTYDIGENGMIENEDQFKYKNSEKTLTQPLVPYSCGLLSFLL